MSSALPSEIWSCVFELVPRQNLKTLRLVSRKFRSLVQHSFKRYFRDIDVYFTKRCVEKLEYIADSKDLSSSVRSVTLVSNSVPWWASASYEWLLDPDGQKDLGRQIIKSIVDLCIISLTACTTFHVIDTWVEGRSSKKVELSGPDLLRIFFQIALRCESLNAFHVKMNRYQEFALTLASLINS